MVTYRTLCKKHISKSSYTGTNIFQVQQNKTRDASDGECVKSIFLGHNIGEGIFDSWLKPLSRIQDISAILFRNTWNGLVMPSESLITFSIKRTGAYIDIRSCSVYCGLDAFSLSVNYLESSASDSRLEIIKNGNCSLELGPRFPRRWGMH